MSCDPPDVGGTLRQMAELLGLLFLFALVAVAWLGFVRKLSDAGAWAVLGALLAGLLG